MLTKRENMIEAIKGGAPDRYVNQFEALVFAAGNLNESDAAACVARPSAEDSSSFSLMNSSRIISEGQRSDLSFSGDASLEAEEWAESMTSHVVFPESYWADARAIAKSIDRNQHFAAISFGPGVFNNLFGLLGSRGPLASLKDDPGMCHQLIDYLTNYELLVAEQYVKNLQPDCVYHHDRWGSATNTFLTPEMFDEFITPAYKKIYGFYKENGVQLIIHRSESFARPLIPSMIEMGVDVWQGVLPSNDISACVKEYGGQIAFMGGIDASVLDVDEWTPSKVATNVREAIKEYGSQGKYFIPCLTSAGCHSVFPGVYPTISNVISQVNCETFGHAIDQV